jgi:hypothetical protein
MSSIKLASVSNDTDIELAHDLRGMLEDMGCVWLRVDNPFDQPLAVAAERVSEALLAQMSSR